MRRTLSLTLLLLAFLSTACTHPLASLRSSPERHASPYDQVRLSVPEVAFLETDGSVSHCTAFAVRINQFITAAHCLSDAVGIQIGTQAAQIVKVDGKKDLALIAVEGEPAYPLLELDAQAPEVGTEVMCLGYPSQVVVPLTFFGRVMGGRVEGEFSDVLFIDGSGARGMSGGPIVRLDNGKVVGMIRGGAAFNAQTRQDVMVYAATLAQLREFLK